MATKHYAVIGHPIGHTMSPFIHTRLFDLSGIDSCYEVFSIAPQELSGKAAFLRSLDGFNITIPHKQSIIPFLDTLDKKAALYGSVNTVKNGEKSVGYTTDPDGFLQALKSAGIPLEGNIVILGTGGVARTMAYETVLANCNLLIAGRPNDLTNAQKLAEHIKKDISGISDNTINICPMNQISMNPIDLLINATPVGMYPNADAMPVPQTLLSRCANVFDAVYNPMDTNLLACARANGAKTLGGLSMLVWQAVVAHQIWDNSVYSAEAVNQLCDDAAEQLQKQFPERRQSNETKL